MKLLCCCLLCCTITYCTAQIEGHSKPDSVNAAVPPKALTTVLPQQLPDLERLVLNINDQKSYTITPIVNHPPKVYSQLNRPNRDLPPPRGSISQGKNPWPYYLWPNRYDWMLYQGREVKTSYP